MITLLVLLLIAVFLWVGMGAIPVSEPARTLILLVYLLGVIIIAVGGLSGLDLRAPLR